MSVLALVALATFGQAEAAAEASVRAQSRTFLMVGGQPYYAAEEGRLVERRVVPVIQELSLDAQPGAPGLSISVDGWLLLQAGDAVLDGRVVGDLAQAFIEWRTKSLTLAAGRVLLYSEAGRGLRLDGARVLVHPRAIGGVAFSLEAFGGLPVNPSFGEEPLRSSTAVFADDPGDLARGGADWQRPGDWAIGGFVRADVRGLVEAGVGYLRVVDLTAIARESLVVSLASRPIAGLEITGFLSHDLFAAAIEDAEAQVAVWPTRGLRLALYGRHTDPALLLPSTSIFSVFGGEAHSEVGLAGDLYVGRRLRVSASGELRRTTPDGSVGEDPTLGGRWLLNVRGTLPGARPVRLSAGIEGLQDGAAGGYHHGRAGVEVPLGDVFGLSGEGGVFWLVANDDGEADELALRGTLATTLTFTAWRASLAVRATHLEGRSSDLAVFGRVEWDIERSF